MKQTQARNTTVVIGSLGIACCVLMLLPVAYFSYRSYASYQTDLNTLNSIATKLDYTPDRRLNFYEAKSMEYDYLGLVFYTQDSVDQFSVKVQSLGFKLEYFMSEEINKRSTTSILQKVNYGLESRFVMLNGRYKSQDFGFGVPQPLESTWKLYSPTRAIEIHYGRVPSSSDVFTYDGKPLKGNVVVVMLHRPTCWGC